MNNHNLTENIDWKGYLKSQIEEIMEDEENILKEKEIQDSNEEGIKNINNDSKVNYESKNIAEV